MKLEANEGFAPSPKIYETFVPLSTPNSHKLFTPMSK